MISGTTSFFFKGIHQPDEAYSLAVNGHNTMQLNYCRMQYPDAKINTYDSIEECLDAVVNGKDSGTIINSHRTQFVTSNSKYDSLSYVQLNSESPMCFGVNEDETELLIILNRGIRMLGSSYGIDHSYKYMEKFVTYSITDFVRDDVDKQKVTISLGYTCDNSRYEKMIGKADKALYFAKDNGKDCAAACDKNGNIDKIKT